MSQASDESSDLNDYRKMYEAFNTSRSAKVRVDQNQIELKSRGHRTVGSSINLSTEIRHISFYTIIIVKTKYICS